jgi:hypothetical protein
MNAHNKSAIRWVIAHILIIADIMIMPDLPSTVLSLILMAVVYKLTSNICQDDTSRMRPIVNIPNANYLDEILY